MITQGKPLTSEERETIVTLKRYFDRTKDDHKEQACPSVRRVVNALGVSIATVKRVMADFNRGVSFQDQDEIRRGRPPQAIQGVCPQCGQRGGVYHSRNIKPASENLESGSGIRYQDFGTGD